MAGWRTDSSTTILLDTSGNGAPIEPINSVSLSSSTVNRHLFSDRIEINNSQSYVVSTWVNLKSINSGEIALYIDEYDINGNWISGRYLGGTNTIGVQTLSYDYKPSSAAVRTVSLQIIVVGGNSGIVGIIDELSLISN
jgi:hypothetical protein